MYSSPIVKEWEQQYIELLKLPELTIKDGLLSELNYKNKNDELHRNIDVGPAVIYYYKDGQTKFEQYWLDGKIHRPIEEGPAYICYFENGHIEYESYWINDKRHRLSEEGPAIIRYDESGQIKYKAYWVNGIYVGQN